MNPPVSVAMVGMIAAGQGGIPRYAARLISAIDAVAGEFPEMEIRLVAHPPALERIRLTGGGLAGVTSLTRARATRGPARIVAEQVAAALMPADVVHLFDTTLPLLAPGRRFVATVHDVAVAHHFDRERRLHKQVLQPGAARRAARLVAVSRFAAAEAVRHLGAEPGRIAVIHSGPGLIAGQSVTPAAVPERAQPRPYMLYVGNLYSHKNLAFLIRAFGASALDVDLLLVGSRGPERSGLEQAIAASAAPERIRILSGIGDTALDGLYRGAEAVLLPSVYEGFGFTALEAMSRRVPVLASDIPALAEVCGDGAMLLPVGDPAAWSAAMARVLADPLLGAELRDRGARVVARYSWLTTARAVCQVFGAVTARAGAVNARAAG